MGQEKIVCMICRLTWQRLDIQEILQLKFWSAAKTRKIKLNCSCTCQTTAFSPEFINYTCHFFTTPTRTVKLVSNLMARPAVGVIIPFTAYFWIKHRSRVGGNIYSAVHLRIITVTDFTNPFIKIPGTLCQAKNSNIENNMAQDIQRNSITLWKSE